MVKEKEKKETKTKIHILPKELICNLGTIAIYIVLCISLFMLNQKFTIPNYEDIGKDLAELIWDSIFSVGCGVIAIVDVIVVLLLINFKKNCSKVIVIIFGIITFLIAIFDNVAIKYPLSQSIIVLVNFIVLIACVSIILFRTGSDAQNIGSTDNDSQMNNISIKTAISRTENRKLVAVQMYKVKTNIVADNLGIEKVQYIVRAGEMFFREGYDINSVSSIIYELDRDIVDNFQAIINSYHSLIQYGKEDIKNKLIDSIQSEILKIQKKLKTLQTDNREVSKEDCCLARVLIIYKSFERMLNSSSIETQAKYIGEVSLVDGDLNLSPDIENRLFTLVRTGVLGAALLGEKARHVFNYRKNGIKQGRKYCASLLKCNDIKQEGDFTIQNMDICLFTVEDNSGHSIPPYVLESISRREEQILKAINKME